MLEEEQIQVLEKFIMESFTQAKDFAETEIPIYVQEYLSWYFWSSVFFVVIFTILTLCTVVLGMLIFKYGKKEDQYEIKALGCVVMIAGVLFFGGGLTENLYDAVKVSVAPRVVIVEVLRGN